MIYLVIITAEGGQGQALSLQGRKPLSYLSGFSETFAS
jgi:hypothetical protein